MPSTDGKVWSNFWPAAVGVKPNEATGFLLVITSFTDLAKCVHKFRHFVSFRRKSDKHDSKREPDRGVFGARHFSKLKPNLHVTGLHGTCKIAASEFAFDAPGARGSDVFLVLDQLWKQPKDG